MSKDIIGPESSPPFLSASGREETGYHPQAYVDFRHIIREGGVIIFHNPDEQKSAAGVTEGLPTQTGGDKKHFAVAVYIADDARYKRALDALESAGFEKEKPKNDDYKLEEKTRLAH